MGRKSSGYLPLRLLLSALSLERFGAEAAQRRVALLSVAPDLGPRGHRRPRLLPRGERGCTFPAGLRPLGCTAYLCKFMYADMDRKEPARVKRLVRELEQHHTALARDTRPVEGREEQGRGGPWCARSL